MKNVPLVSIALCTYNGERFLRQQLESLVNQTYSNIEIIAVDDCSVDNTSAILQEFERSDCRFKVFANPENLGFIKNFERAITLCSGDYIALCDQDDIWDLKKIEKLVDHIGSSVMIYHDSELIDEEGNKLSKKVSDRFFMFSGNDPRELLLFNCVSGHSIMFKRCLLPEIMPLKLKVYHDWWISYVAANNGHVAYLNKVFVYYRQHAASQTDIVNRKKVKKTKRFFLREWLEYCNSYPGNKYPEFVNTLATLYAQRAHSVLIFRLGGFLLRHFKVLFAIQRKTRLSKLNFIFKQVFGGN